MFLLRHRITTTATYGRGFKPTGVADEFKIKIYTGGGGNSGTADNRVADEIAKFAPTQGYVSHKIVKRSYSFIPSGYTYIVQFSR